MQECWEPGRLVISVAGRDKGHTYLVLRRLDHSNVLVVDGITRKVTKPKCKNIKHLKAHWELDVNIKEKVDKGLRVTDSDVQKIIRDFKSRHQSSGLSVGNA
ncbi:MAG: RNA-binding protein [Peptococcaceae bacterium]|nr:RNA-binding protein [Peptococcaceae bacterium]